LPRLALPSAVSPLLVSWVTCMQDGTSSWCARALAATVLGPYEACTCKLMQCLMVYTSGHVVCTRYCCPTCRLSTAWSTTGPWCEEPACRIAGAYAHRMA
jgi:hypothetical protein